MKFEDYTTLASNLFKEGKDADSVRTELAGAGAAEDVIQSIISQLQSQNFLKRRKRGIAMGVTGSVLLLIGFVLTVIFFHSGVSINYVMYGLTSLGVILLMAGMVDVLGW